MTRPGPLVCILKGEAVRVNKKFRYVEFHYLEESHFENRGTIEAAVIFNDHPKKVFKSRAVGRGSIIRRRGWAQDEGATL
jgi:hypothetical protein